MLNIVQFEQSTPSDTWTIMHSLGCKPVFDVVVDGVKMYPANVVHVSDNVLELTFSTPRTGVARLFGTSLTNSA